MTLLAENGDYQLFKTKLYVSCNYIVYKKAGNFRHEIARSMLLVKKVTKFFTESQIEAARRMLRTSALAGLS